jgi:hypothetical protein
VKFVLALLAVAAVATPHPVTESANWGNVHAALTYTYDPEANDFSQMYTNMRLVIQRSGATALDRPPTPPCVDCPVVPGSGGSPKSSSVRVADLDRNGEPVVLLDLYSGGAHCCSYTVFYRWDGTEYVTTRHDWGNPGYRFVDLGHDGISEFVTRDDRFNYAFSCFACSGTPVRVMRVVNRRLVDVTREFPALIRSDAAGLWRAYRAAARRREDVSGLLPAYVADEYLLGHGRAAWARLRRAVASPSWRRTVTDPRWKNRQRYLVDVRRFLRRTGYLRWGSVGV